MPPVHPKPSLYRRITASVPLLVTVIVHVVVIALAGYFVVSEQILDKKNSFAAAALPETSSEQKKVEHRLQVARKGGGSASSSPVSAARIFSTADNALQLPAMPDLPSVGASSLRGMGFGAGMGAAGTGTGYNTVMSSGNSLGQGFMSMSFLGVTNQRVRKVAFVVDISPDLMDIRKGGFRAFEILRMEISRLVAALPPSSEFNIVFFSGPDIRLFSSALQPASVANKTAFIEWIKPINADLHSLGTRSIPAASPRWTYSPAETLKLDADYRPPFWVNALHAALEQKPDTIFMITGSAGNGYKGASQAELSRRVRDQEKYIAELKRHGYDLPAIAAARNRALSRLRSEFESINQKLIAAKKPPFVIGDIRRVLDEDFQAALKRAGFSLKIDTTGWTDKEGRAMWNSPGSDKVDHPADGVTGAEFRDALGRIARLQHGLLRERASINIFLFTGPDEKDEATEKNLASVTSRNSGKFNLLTTKRLEEIARGQPSP